MRNKPVEREMTDAEMIANPENWPQWPVLPLKNPPAKGGRPKFAYMVASSETFGEGKYTLFHGNMWAIDVENDQREVFPTIGAITAAGWMVD